MTHFVGGGPAASGVTGRRSNQLNYDPARVRREIADCRLLIVVFDSFPTDSTWGRTITAFQVLITSSGSTVSPSTR